MAKEDLLTIEGTIDEMLPGGRFGVLLDNEVRIIAYTAGKMRRYRIRSIVGDRVHVEMTPYDVSKGRIGISREDGWTVCGTETEKLQALNRESRAR